MSIFTNNLTTNRNIFDDYDDHEVQNDHEAPDDHEVQGDHEVPDDHEAPVDRDTEHFDDALAKKDMNNYIKKKQNTLDRKIVMTNNYSIIHQNRIVLLKYAFYFLIILNTVYIGVTLYIIPKFIAYSVLSFLVIVFFVLVVIIILKNSRLYNINMEEKYYPKHNPYNLLHYLTKKKKCNKNSVHLKKTNQHVQTLERILLEIKRLSLKFEMYDEAKNASTHLQMMDDHKYKKNAIYSYKANEQELLDEIKVHNDILKNVRIAITNKLHTKLEDLRRKSDTYKKNMETVLTDIQNDNTDKINKNKTYKMEQYKLTMVTKHINQLQKDLNRL